jgi:ferritin-like metal-binding protein YciE
MRLFERPLDRALDRAPPVRLDCPREVVPLPLRPRACRMSSGEFAPRPLVLPARACERLLGPRLLPLCDRVELEDLEDVERLLLLLDAIALLLCAARTCGKSLCPGPRTCASFSPQGAGRDARGTVIAASTGTPHSHTGARTMSELNSLRDLLLDQMRDTLSAEKQLLKALPAISKAATSKSLSKAFDAHLADTKEQVTRLERCFDLLDESPTAKHCKGMEGLITEVMDHLEADGESAIVDAAIVAAVQRIEHYEICAYGCMVHYAELLEHDDVAALLTKSLNEEKSADEKLTDISDVEVMDQAMGVGEEAEVR